MAYTVTKIACSFDDGRLIDIPSDRVWLDATIEFGLITLWILANVKSPLETVQLRVLREGEELADPSTCLYRGSVWDRDREIFWHVWTCPPPPTNIPV